MMRYPPSSLRRRPESRQMRAHGAPPLYLDPGLRRDDNVLSSRHIQKRRVFDDAIPAFVAPAAAGVQADARAWRAASLPGSSSTPGRQWFGSRVLGEHLFLLLSTRATSRAR